MEHKHHHRIDADLPLTLKTTIRLWFVGLLIVAVWGVTIIHFYWPNTFESAQLGLNDTIATALGTIDTTAKTATQKNWAAEFESMKQLAEDALAEPVVPLEALPLEE